MLTAASAEFPLTGGMRRDDRLGGAQVGCTRCPVGELPLGFKPKLAAAQLTLFLQMSA